MIKNLEEMWVHTWYQPGAELGATLMSSEMSLNDWGGGLSQKHLLRYSLSGGHYIKVPPASPSSVILWTSL